MSNEDIIKIPKMQRIKYIISIYNKKFNEINL